MCPTCGKFINGPISYGIIFITECQVLRVNYFVNFSEVICRPNGSSQVTAVRVPSLPAITSRLRAKSLSENSSGIGPSPSSSVMQMNNWTESKSQPVFWEIYRWLQHKVANAPMVIINLCFKSNINSKFNKETQIKFFEDLEFSQNKFFD
jgi:hypothetical protein